MRCSPNADVMMAQRRRRWPSITSELGEHLVFAVCIHTVSTVQRRVRWFSTEPGIKSSHCKHNFTSERFVNYIIMTEHTFRRISC